MLAVWEDVWIIHEFHHLSGHCLSLRLTRGKSFFINLCCGSFFPDFQTAYVSRVCFFPPSTEVSPTSCLPRWLFIWYWAKLRWQRHDVVHPQGLATCRLPRCSWTSWRSCRRSEIMRPKGGNDAWSQGKRRMNFKDGCIMICILCIIDFGPGLSV